MEKTYPNEEFHLGSRIKAELERQGRSAAWLSRQVHCTPENIYKTLRQQWVTLPRLFMISEALNHDFFKDCSDYLLAEKAKKQL